MEYEEIKNKYGELAKKYNLAGFKEVSEQFELEKIDTYSDCFARIVRKTMMDKIINSMSFLDMLLNPVNAPRIYLPYIKSMNAEDKKTIDTIYEMFAQLSLDCLALELNYSEKKEAEMIKKIYNGWEEIRPDFTKIMERIARPHNSALKKEKSYYG